MQKLLAFILFLLLPVLSASAEDEIVIDEDFHRFIQEKNSNSDVSTSLDDYLDAKGFSGTKLYRGKCGMKMSTTSVSAELRSPVLHESSGKLSFTISSEVFESEESDLYLYIYDTEDEWPLYLSNPIPSGTTQTLNLENIPETYRFMIMSEKRCYLTKLLVTHPKDSSTDITEGTDISHDSPPLYNAPYNLNGQQASKDFRGIIIKDGRKYLAR